MPQQVVVALVELQINHSERGGGYGCRRPEEASPLGEEREAAVRKRFRPRAHKPGQNII